MIKVKFVDFWKGFDLENDWIYKFLKSNFNIQISENPDFLIYSCYGREYLKYSCVKIFFCPENIRPNYLECDYSLSFDFYNKQCHYRLPLYGALVDFPPERLIKREKLTQESLIGKKFCCFLSSNENAEFRNYFFDKLSDYKKVDSGGLVKNNIGFRVVDKMEFISNYKFIIAFENSSYPGYVTEKIWQPFFVDAIPIYWGSPMIEKDFNSKRFINVHDFSSLDEVIKTVIKIDQDDELYLKMVNEPVFHNDKINNYLDRLKILNFFSYIFSENKTPVSKTYKKYIAYLYVRFRNLKIKVFNFYK